jgi:hypothetical protein
MSKEDRWNAEVAFASQRIAELEDRIRELEACVLEYWHAKDWGAVGAADATAAKLLPADMKTRAASAAPNRGGEHE